MKSSYDIDFERLRIEFEYAKAMQWVYFFNGVSVGAIISIIIRIIVWVATQ